MLIFVILQHLQAIIIVIVILTPRPEVTAPLCTRGKVLQRFKNVDFEIFMMRTYFLIFNICLIDAGEPRSPRRDSESDSDGSQADAGGRSLDLASSHSSDDEDVTSKSHKNMGVSTQQTITHSYLPNIHSTATEHLNILCSNTELFPNIKPIYAPRWSSQLPEAYLPTNGMEKHKLKIISYIVPILMWYLLI